jgi:hypothetical protein
MAHFEKELPTLLEDINQAFIFKQSRFSGVCVLAFEREAMSTSMVIETPSCRPAPKGSHGIFRKTVLPAGIWPDRHLTLMCSLQTQKLRRSS